MTPKKVEERQVITSLESAKPILIPALKVGAFTGENMFCFKHSSTVGESFKMLLFVHGSIRHTAVNPMCLLTYRGTRVAT